MSAQRVGVVASRVRGGAGRGDRARGPVDGVRPVGWTSVRSRAGRWTTVVAVLLAVACAPPDRRAEADVLERRIAQMPGVERVDVRYTDGLSLGPNIGVDVVVTGADTAQIVAVATTVADAVSADFDGYGRSVSFRVADGGELEVSGDPVPATVGERTRALRELLTDVPGARVSWSESADAQTVAVSDAAPAPVLASLRAQAPASGLVVTIRGDGHRPWWTVVLPLAVTDETVVRAAVERSPLPVSSIRVQDGHAAAVTVRTHEDVQAHEVAAVEEAIGTVIELFAPTPAHPLLLDWEGPEADDRDAPGFAGRVHVGGCAYPRSLGETEPERFYTPEAIELRDRLRDRYDRCD